MGGKIAYCEGKVQLSFMRAKQINQRDGSKEKGRSVYHCPVCKHWHLGSIKSIKRP